MLRKITRTGQLCIPKKVLASLHIYEGDYVNIESMESAIVIRRAGATDFSAEDYDKLAARLAEAEAEEGRLLPDSQSARKHLEEMMK
jgi:AbrB family looped-hinge helix DNA binding protein